MKIKFVAVIGLVIGLGGCGGSSEEIIKSDGDEEDDASLSLIGDDGYVLAGALPLINSATEEGKVLYVDLSVGKEGCFDYDPSTRQCGSGDDRVFGDLPKLAAFPGDTILFRGGKYQEKWTVRHSGTEKHRIIYKAYPGETVLFTGANLSPAINLSYREYVTLEGFTVSDVGRWLYARKASYNIIKNNTFRRATDASGGAKTGLFFAESYFNKLINNDIEDNPQDLLSLISSDKNLVEGNQFRSAGHSLWSIRCGNYNVVRNNYFHNEKQKIGEVYDCAKTAGYELYDSSRRNLIESNDFAYVPSSGNKSPFSGIQYAGQQGIIRKNRFYDTQGPGLRFTIYGTEAQFNWGNRIYNNVFLNSDYAGVRIGGASAALKFEDNIFKNNILAGSRFVANDTRWSLYTDILAGEPVQLKTVRLDGFTFENNNFYSEDGTRENFLITHGGRHVDNYFTLSLDEWQKKYPSLFKNNVSASPMFTLDDDQKYHLSAGSAMRDAAAFLSHTTEAGVGVVVPLSDVSYFYDGFDIPDELGDVIQFEAQTQTARIVDIDYAANTITLDREMIWAEGQGIALAYSGAAPDIGAYEFVD